MFGSWQMCRWRREQCAKGPSGTGEEGLDTVSDEGLQVLFEMSTAQKLVCIFAVGGFANWPSNIRTISFQIVLGAHLRVLKIVNHSIKCP